MNCLFVVVRGVSKVLMNHNLQQSIFNHVILDPLLAMIGIVVFALLWTKIRRCATIAAVEKTCINFVKKILNLFLWLSCKPNKGKWVICKQIWFGSSGKPVVYLQGWWRSSTSHLSRTTPASGQRGIWTWFTALKSSALNHSAIKH